MFYHARRAPRKLDLLAFESRRGFRQGICSDGNARRNGGESEQEQTRISLPSRATATEKLRSIRLPRIVAAGADARPFARPDPQLLAGARGW
jgi:hypothetical protein